MSSKDDRRGHAGFFIVDAEGVPTMGGAKSSKVGCVVARVPPEVLNQLLRLACGALAQPLQKYKRYH
jgi:hypothetical protein